MYGEACKALRERRGWSQQKLAEEAGASISEICNIEKNRRLLSEPLIIRLARLGMDVGLEGKDEY